MHEAAIADALLEQVRTLAPEGTKLRAVNLDVGGLEHLDALVLNAAWSGLTAGGAFEGAELEVKRIAVRVRCRACGTDSQPEDPAILTCGKCGAVRPEVTEGTGVVLRSLEVEEVR